MDMNLHKLKEIVENRGDWRATVHELTQSYITYQLNNHSVFCILLLQEMSAQVQTLQQRGLGSRSWPVSASEGFLNLKVTSEENNVFFKFLKNV